MENKSVKDFIGQEKETYDKKSVRKLEEKVDNSFKGSFDNERSEKIKGCSYDEELSHYVFRVTRLGKRGKLSTDVLKSDFEENWLPQYNHCVKIKLKNFKKNWEFNHQFYF